MKDYLQTNRILWNKKTGVHLHSKFYDQAGFLAGKSTLKDIELALLGDIKGKRILHLQCHFGQDTISLARIGATVTGVDLSDEAIKQAKATAQQLGLDQKVDFICCDVQSLDEHLDEKFDIVFTSYGTIAWLPTIDKWGQIIAHFLKPTGQFIFVEFHPMVWMLDDDFKKVAYPYFNTQTFHEEFTTSYTDGEGHEPAMGYSWNHPLSEVIQVIIDSKLAIKDFKEYDYSPYNCFPNAVKGSNGYQIGGFEGKLAMVYSIVARLKH
ncbi:MAG: class I SAM-dependent methyltransferase [Bacteroidota bacterium]